MTLKEFEEEILKLMYDNEIVGMNYRPIKMVSHEVDWVELQQKYHIRKSFDSVMKSLESSGYVFSHGKSGRVYSLTNSGLTTLRVDSPNYHIYSSILV